MTTTLVVIAHPDGDEDHPIKLVNGQKVALRRTFRLLDKFVGDRQVAVLAPPTKAVDDYSRLVAGHFLVDFTPCEGLLRDGKGGRVDDGCDCIDDYLDERFGLIVVIAGKDIAKKLSKMLSNRVGRPYEEMHTPGMTLVYVI